MKKLLFPFLLITLMLLPIISIGTVQVKAQEEYPREQTMIMGSSFELPDPTNWNWMKPGAYALWFSGVSGLVLEQLFYINYYTDELIPWMATGFEYNEDYTKIKITLREGVKWNDGTPFTADDSVFTYRLHLESPEILLHSPEIRENIKVATKIDDFVCDKP